MVDKNVRAQSKLKANVGMLERRKWQTVKNSYYQQVVNEF